MNWHNWKTKIVLNDMFAPDKNSLHFLRFAAATLIFTLHSLPLDLGGKVYKLNVLHLPVFFVISGILIARSIVQSRSIKHFLAKRFFRVAPLAWVTVLLLFLFIMPLFSNDGLSHFFANSLFYKKLAQQLTLLTTDISMPSVNNGASMHSSYWSIVLEIRLYLLMALVYFINKRWLKHASFAIIIGCIIYTYGLNELNKFPKFITYFGWFDYVSELVYLFFVGAILFFYSKKIVFNRLQILVSFIILLGLHFTFALPQLVDLLIPVLWVILIGFCFGNYFNRYCFKADVSYGLYLLGPIVQSLLHFVGFKNGLVFWLIAYPTSMLIAVLSYNLFESKITNWYQHKSKL